MEIYRMKKITGNNIWRYYSRQVCYKRDFLMTKKQILRIIAFKEGKEFSRSKKETENTIEKSKKKIMFQLKDQHAKW